MSFNPSKLLLAAALISTTPAWAALTVNADGTVTDTATSLVWDRCSYGLTGPACAGGTALLADWPTALTTAVAANAANYKGFNDWRVPNMKELESIVKIDTSSPAIDSTAFPATPITGGAGGYGIVWSSTSYAPLPVYAWEVRFVSGLHDVGITTGAGYVRLVRSGQPLAAFEALATNTDLSVTVTDGVSSATPGGSVTYTIVASNAGTDAVTGATVADTFPAACTSASWTCAGSGGGTCSASGNGNISDSTVNLPVGASVSYTAVCSISASATGSLVNTATVSGALNTDPTPGNNSATDTDTLTPQANLIITKTNGVTSVTPGASTTYTIVASNAGPSNAPGTVVTDTVPAALSGATWTCVGAGGGTCTASGSGNINQTVNLPAGASVTYTVTATVSAAATGTLSNTATVAAASGITDPTPGNNTATDTDTVNAPTVAAPIPTLSEWGAILLSGLMLLFGWRQVRRRR